MEQSTFPYHPILMVDDERLQLIGLDTMLRSNGFNNIICCNDSRQVASIVSDRQIELILLDLFMPDISGEEILMDIRRDFPDLPVIIITGENTTEMTVKCIKSGAFDYLVKPVEEGRLLTSVKRAIEFKELQKENVSLKSQIFSDTRYVPDAFSEIITQHPRMHAIFQYAQAIAPSPMPVLITGETGVGKELLVEAIHALSDVKGELVKINIAGLDDTMFNDTLFGHLKGAFTGAETARSGLIEQAKNGTLFLDEIGELPLPSQIKLLRLLQSREYYPAGSDSPEFSHARVIAATNLPLEAMYHSTTFRKDLYYRLQTHHIHIPPLRERLEDIPILFEHFMAQASNMLNKAKPTAPEELYILLATYHYPGNIRELQSMVYDAASKHTSKKLSTASFKLHMQRNGFLPDNIAQGSAAKPPLSILCDRFPTLKETEHWLINQALKRSKGNQSIAAHLLGISRQALNRRLQSPPQEHAKQ